MGQTVIKGHKRLLLILLPFLGAFGKAGVKTHHLSRGGGGGGVGVPERMNECAGRYFRVYAGRCLPLEEGILHSWMGGLVAGRGGRGEAGHKVLHTCMSWGGGGAHLDPSTRKHGSKKAEQQSSGSIVVYGCDRCMPNPFYCAHAIPCDSPVTQNAVLV